MAGAGIVLWRMWKRGSTLALQDVMNGGESWILVLYSAGVGICGRWRRFERGIARQAWELDRACGNWRVVGHPFAYHAQGILLGMPKSWQAQCIRCGRALAAGVSHNTVGGWQRASRSAVGGCEK